MSNALIAGVGDIKIPVLIKANSGGTVGLCALSRTAIAAETSIASSSDDFDSVALEIHTSNLVGARFGKTQGLRRLKGQTGRLPQIGQNCCDAAGCAIHAKNTTVFRFEVSLLPAESSARPEGHIPNDVPIVGSRRIQHPFVTSMALIEARTLPAEQRAN
jgi:hypothetical protein